MSDHKTVVTSVVLISTNNVSDEDVEELLESHDTDDFSEVVENMEETLKVLIEQRVFADADNIPILDVSTDVHDGGWDKESMEETMENLTPE